MVSLIPQTDAGQSGIIFAYLAVRPRPNTFPDISTEYIKNGVGNLPAKIRAKNDCASENVGDSKWRVLIGFYTHLSNWKRKIKPKWSQYKLWELALLGGVRLACKYGVNSTLYVSSEAQSKPRSALLRTLQWFTLQGEGGKVVARGKSHTFWKTVMSTTNSLAQLNGILARQYPIPSDAF